VVEETEKRESILQGKTQMQAQLRRHGGFKLLISKVGVLVELAPPEAEVGSQQEADEPCHVVARHLGTMLCCTSLHCAAHCGTLHLCSF
jgi:hypothetical protein